MEGKFLNFPGKRETNTFVRKKENVPKDQFEKSVDLWEEKVSRGEADAIMQQYEIPKTPEQEAILNFVLEGIRKTLERYGVNNDTLGLDDIHLLGDEFWEKVGRPGIGGASLPLSNKVGIRMRKDGRSTNSWLADTAFHEIMHQHGFTRAAFEGEREDRSPEFSQERLALSVASPKDGDSFFYNLNEAITSELAHNFVQENRDHPFLRDDFRRIRERFSENEEKGASFLVEEEMENGDTKVLWGRAHLSQMQDMYAMFDDVIESHPEKFSSREEVFDVFAKAYFSGRLLEVSRLLKETYGKDKTIKEIAEEQGL